MDIDWEDAKEDLLEFIVDSVNPFLRLDETQTFYALALDIDFEHLEVNVALNSLKQHQDVMKRFYPTADPEDTAGELEIKYNTGDWEDGTIATKYLAKGEIFDKFVRSATDAEVAEVNEKFKETIWGVLKTYVITKSYQLIPKEKPFVAFVIDHEEEVTDALARAKREGTSELPDFQ